VIRPYPTRGNVTNLGGTAMVNGQMYNLAVMAIGFTPAPCPVTTDNTVKVGNMSVAKSNAGDTIDGIPTVFKIGSAAALTAAYGPYQSRFSAAQLSMYNQLPRVAALAAYLD
jgi:hypothetical protein